MNAYIIKPLLSRFNDIKNDIKTNFSFMYCVDTAECILLAIIFSFGIVNFFTNYSISRLYPVMLFAVLILKNIKRLIPAMKDMLKIIIPFLIIIVIALLWMLLYKNGMREMRYFIIQLIAGFNAYFFTSKKINRTMNIMAFIVVLFGVYLVAHIGDAKFLTQLAFDEDGYISYLTIMFPMGLTACLFCSRLFAREAKDMRLWNLLGFVFILFIMFNFAGRGYLMFSLALFIIFLARDLIMYQKRLKLFLILLFSLIALLLVVYFFIMSPALKFRMLSLFYNLTEEPRLKLYGKFFSNIVHNMRWVFGIGFKMSTYLIGQLERHPHNILFELWGELGIIGLACLVFILVNTYRNSAINGSRINRLAVDGLNPAVLSNANHAVNMMLIFFTFNYMLYYSLIEKGYYLFIPMAMVFAIRREIIAAEAK